eukprot:11221631-Lingulodinium_polyedra.AAC.1
MSYVVQQLPAAQAILQMKHVQAAYANYIVAVNIAHCNKSMDQAREVLVSAMVTRFECMAGRAALRGKNKRNQILAA